MTAARWTPTALPLDQAELVLALERLVYGPSDVGERPYYDWLYRANPAGDAIAFYAATGDPAVPSGGHYIVIPVRMTVRGDDVAGSLSLNTLTHPAYRRQGVFVTLAERVFAECVRRGIGLTYGFPNPNSLPGFVGPLRFADIGRVPLLVAPLDPGAIAPEGATAARRLLVRSGARAAAVLAALARVRWAPSQTRVTEETGVSDAWNALWARVRGKYPVMVTRDQAYIAWRFGACPTRRYRLWVAWANGDPIGFVATRVGTILGMRAGLVVDLLVAPGRRNDAGAALVAAAIREFRAAGVALATALVPRRTEEHAALRRAGFLPCPRALEPQPFPVILRSHGAAVPAAIDAWFLTMGDYDAV